MENILSEILLIIRRVDENSIKVGKIAFKHRRKGEKLRHALSRLYERESEWMNRVLSLSLSLLFRSVYFFFRSLFRLPSSVVLCSANPIVTIFCIGASQRSRGEGPVNSNISIHQLWQLLIESYSQINSLYSIRDFLYPNLFLDLTSPPTPL